MALNAFNRLVPAVIIVLGGEVNVSQNHQPNHDKARKKTRSERNPSERRWEDLGDRITDHQLIAKRSITLKITTIKIADKKMRVSTQTRRCRK
jgi:hypothetical protein